MQREEISGILDLAAAIAEACEAPACSQQSTIGVNASSGRSAGSRHTASNQASSFQRQQRQKIERLVAAAQQRVLQGLPSDDALEAQRGWNSATEAATRSSNPLYELAAFPKQGNAFTGAGVRRPVVTPEWITSCWEEARRITIDSAHGEIEV